MPDKKLHIIIVGGSLAGLMQGIVIKRLGHHVTILEQHLSSTREGQAAGIVTMEHSHMFMTLYDLLKDQPYAVGCSGVQFLDKDLHVKGGYDRPMRMSSWNVLYYRFRANFDGFTSSYCPSAPKESTSNGRAIYDQGKLVTNVKYVDGLVTVEFEDLANEESGSHGSLQADLVIAADGSTSHIRQLLQPHLKHAYAGYVAWRGTVPESKVSEEARNTFQLKTTIHASHSGYIALYTIPGENGALEEGKRLLNYVWYTNIAEHSEDYAKAMTDNTGRKHRQTLPIGKMRSDVWEKQCALASIILPRPFAELVHKTAHPFVSSIVDIGVSQPSFFDGKLLFVGDALEPFRPHVACSTNQAALDALLVGKLLNGEIDFATWTSQVTEYATLTRLQSITWGSWYQFGYIAFLFSEARYYLAWYMNRLWRYWQNSVKK